MKPALQKAFAAYDTALNNLKNKSSNTDPTILLKCLVMRDEIDKLLSENTFDNPTDLLKLTELDKQLAEYASASIELPNLKIWRRSRSPSDEAWWWFLDKEDETKDDKGDVIWSFVVVICLTLALSLLTDIAKRFLVLGPDLWGLLATISPAVLGLLATGGALTKTGQRIVEKLFKIIKVKRHRRQEWLVGLSVLLLAIFAISWLSLPLFARIYNNKGVRHWKDGQLTDAIKAYRLATSLDPHYAEANFNLAVIYEVQQRYDEAIKTYQVALENQANLDVTYNNLARLYIAKEDDYGAAVELLLRGRTLAQDDSVRYALAKNLGWAYLKLNRYQEAEEELREAILIRAEGAASHCLLAQTLEALDAETGAKTSEPLDEWRDCLAFGPDETKFEENTWASMARQKLEEK